MVTYTSLVNFTEQGIREIKGSPKRLTAAKKLLGIMGGRFRGFYLTMGAYDIVTVTEAPDDDNPICVANAIDQIGNGKALAQFHPAPDP